MILIIKAHNVTPDLQSMLYNIQLIYTSSSTMHILSTYRSDHPITVPFKCLLQCWMVQPQAYIMGACIIAYTVIVFTPSTPIENMQFCLYMQHFNAILPTYPLCPRK